jgi:hypothetical protein
MNVHFVNRFFVWRSNPKGTVTSASSETRRPDQRKPLSGQLRNKVRIVANGQIGTLCNYFRLWFLVESLPLGVRTKRVASITA